jgi:putative aldouronate transport system permease protein
MLGISQEYYEAAEIDGASRWQQILKITIPLLTPVIIINVLLSVGRIFYADFGLFYYVTRDTSVLYGTTDVIDTYVFRALRQVGDFGMAGAAGLYQSVVGFATVLFANWVVKRIDREKSIF